MEQETFLDKEVGYKYTTSEMVISPEDVETIYNFLGDTETLFTDDDFAKSMELDFKGKIVAGLFLIMVFGKLDMTMGYAYDAVLLGMDDIKFMSPAYVGDRLRVEGELLNKRTTSKGHVLVNWKWTLKNQDNTDILTGVNTEMFPKTMVS